jgi:Cof subfamily protein (haloacid dehalogenase superfamily)
MPIRLIGIDIDGTLLDSRGQMPDVNRDAIHDAVAAGVHVALVTGRSFPFARPIANPLPPSITLIVSNGAIERSMNGATLARRLLDRKVARGVLIFDRDTERQVIFENMDWEQPNRRGYWSRNQSLIDRCVPLEEALDEDPIQVMFNGGVMQMRSLAEVLDAEARAYAVSLTEYEHRDFSLIDITSPAATKGRALAWRAAEMGIGRDEVMAVGDNFNDLEMLEIAGTPVVMGNAVAALRARGWHVTGGQDEGGLAQAIRRFAL